MVFPDNLVGNPEPAAKLAPSSTTLEEDMLFLREMHVFSGVTLQKDSAFYYKVVDDQGETVLQFYKDTTSNYKLIKDQDTVHYDLNSERFERVVRDQIEAIDIFRLIEDQYDLDIVHSLVPFSPETGAFTSSDTTINGNTARRLMWEIGKFPPTYLKELRQIVIVDQILSEKNSIAGFYASGSRTIVLEEDAISWATSHEIGHFVEHVHMQSDSSDWIDLNPTKGEVYHHRDDWQHDTVSYETQRKGFLRVYGRKNWHEDIGTLFELFVPQRYQQAVQQVGDDEILAKKLAIIYGMEWDPQDPTSPPREICHCAYTNSYPQLDFLPHLASQTGQQIDPQFWDDLIQNNYQTTPEAGWYWNRRLPSIQKIAYHVYTEK